jgi:hypothetical protein
LSAQVGIIMLNDMICKHVADAVNFPLDIVHQVRKIFNLFADTAQATVVDVLIICSTQSARTPDRVRIPVLNRPLVQVSDLAPRLPHDHLRNHQSVTSLARLLPVAVLIPNYIRLVLSQVESQQDPTSLVKIQELQFWFDGLRVCRQEEA